MQLCVDVKNIKNYCFPCKLELVIKMTWEILISKNHFLYHFIIFGNRQTWTFIPVKKNSVNYLNSLVMFIVLENNH